MNSDRISNTYKISRKQIKPWNESLSKDNELGNYLTSQEKYNYY